MEEKNKPYGYIYMIVNLVNGKKYIGQTTNSIYTRFRGHVRNSRNNNNMLICKAIKKHGEDKFLYGEIDKANSQKELNLLEAKYINKYQTNDKNIGYNVAEIDLDGKYKHSEETRKKISHINSVGPKNLVNKENGKKSRGSVRKNSASKYCQVKKSGKRWEASIKINNRQIYLGTYKTDIEAAQAHDIAELEYDPTTIKLNFPELKEDYLKGKIKPKRTTRSD